MKPDRRKPRLKVPESQTVARLRAAGRTRLEPTSETPGLDADVLVEHVTGFDRTQMILRADDELDELAVERYQQLLERRSSGEPVAYLVGSKSFRMIDLFVDDRVLVPRPETELLVDIGLAAIARLPGRIRIVDVGTGSGAIALALATEMPRDRREDVSIIASDISQDALDVASHNINRYELAGRVQVAHSNVLDDLDGRFDIVLANLPYLRDDQRHPSTASEPPEALYAGVDGLDLYRRLFKGIGSRLSAHGLVAVEIDPAQADAVHSLATQDDDRDARLLNDLAGMARVVVAGHIDIVRTVAETCSYGA